MATAIPIMVPATVPKGMDTTPITPMKTVFTPVTSGTLEAFTVSEELSEK